MLRKKLRVRKESLVRTWNGENLAKRRAKWKYSRAQLASKMNAMNPALTINESHVRYWEKGGEPSANKLMAMSDALTCPAETFFDFIPFEEMALRFPGVMARPILTSIK